MKIGFIGLGVMGQPTTLNLALKNIRLVAEAARCGGPASPLLDVCHAPFADTEDLGHGLPGKGAVIRAIEARTQDCRPGLP